VAAPALDPVYPVVFIDAIQGKIRDGSVANRPIDVALGHTVDGERDSLGLWAGDGGEGAKLLAARAHRGQRPRRGRLLRRGLRRPAGAG
jgi:transposase-like protein